MSEFVILGSGKVPRRLADRTDRRPLAIVLAESIRDAVAKFLKAKASQETGPVEAIHISAWGFTGTYIEPDGENEPICSICIEEDGGFTGDEVELPVEKEGPCWRCKFLLLESGIEFID